MGVREATILIVPGLRDHVAEHWQSLLASRLPSVRTVPPMGRDDLDCAVRVAAIEREAAAVDGPLLLVAHSGGAVMVAHWARQSKRPVQGALARNAAGFRAAASFRLPDNGSIASWRMVAGSSQPATVP